MNYSELKKLSQLDARIPKWNLGNLLKRPCPICSATKETSLFIRPDLLKINYCENCGTYFVSPAPALEDINNFYLNYHNSYSRMPNYTPYFLKKTYNQYEPLGDVRIRKLHSLLSVKNSKILDLGFGQPYLLYLLKRLGAETYGIDIDPKAVEYANYMKIHSVYEGDFLTYNSDTKFDVIIMTDFVEHPLLPMEYINKAYSFLRKDGYLLIWTPNGRGTIDDDEPITFRVDLEHMQYFTNQTISFISNKLNMEIVHIETCGKPDLQDMDKLAKSDNLDTISHYYKIIKRLTKKFLRDSILREDSEKIIMPMELGNYHLFTVLKKLNGN